MTARLLTDQELGVLDLLVEATRGFAALPEERPGEATEWRDAVHRLQDMVMSRAATRAYPDRCTPLRQKAST